MESGGRGEDPEKESSHSPRTHPGKPVPRRRLRAHRRSTPHHTTPPLDGAGRCRRARRAWCFRCRSEANSDWSPAAPPFDSGAPGAGACPDARARRAATTFANGSPALGGLLPSTPGPDRSPPGPLDRCDPRVVPVNAQPRGTCGTRPPPTAGNQVATIRCDGRLRARVPAQHAEGVEKVRNIARAPCAQGCITLWASC